MPALDETLHLCDDAVSCGNVEICLGVFQLLAELTRVCDEKRLSFHYFNKMLPYAARACAYSKRAIRCKVSGSEDESMADVRLLSVVNTTWLILGEMCGGLGLGDQIATQAMASTMNACREQLAVMQVSIAPHHKWTFSVPQRLCLSLSPSFWLFLFAHDTQPLGLDLWSRRPLHVSMSSPFELQDLLLLSARLFLRCLVVPCVSPGDV